MVEWGGGVVGEWELVGGWVVVGQWDGGDGDLAGMVGWWDSGSVVV